MAWASRSRRARATSSLLAAEVRVQQLDGDLAVELGVPRGVDDAHAAGADQAQDVEPADLDRECRGTGALGAVSNTAAQDLADACRVSAGEMRVA
jgi:hypothetical protein